MSASPPSRRFARRSSTSPPCRRKRRRPRENQQSDCQEKGGGRRCRNRQDGCLRGPHPAGRPHRRLRAVQHTVRALLTAPPLPPFTLPLQILLPLHPAFPPHP